MDVKKKKKRIQNLSDEFSQSRVAQQQPASGRDAVGFILKLVWFQIAEITEPEGKTNVLVKTWTQPAMCKRINGQSCDYTCSHLSLDDVGVYLSDSVDCVRPHDAQVRHVDPLAPIFLDQGHRPQLVHVVGIQSRDPLRGQSRRSSGIARVPSDERFCESCARVSTCEHVRPGGPG